MAEAARKIAIEEDGSSPAFISPAYRDMEPRWALGRDLFYRGTEAMRDEANLDTYFPKGDAETTTERLARAMRAELFPMFKDTVKGLVGLVFRKDPELQKNVPASIVQLWENIDGQGNHGAIFTRRVFTDAMVKGHSGVFVDAPRNRTGKTLTKSQERALGLRPYWIHIRPEQVINWRTTVIDGRIVLSLLVIEERVEIADGDFGVAEVTRYRVFRLLPDGRVQWQIWEKADGDNLPKQLDAEEGEGILANVTRIPYVPIYAGERTAPMQSIPPLLDLEYTNIAHIQVLSDRRSSLHFAGNPILVIKGRVGGVPGSADPNSPEAVAAQVGQSIDNPASEDTTNFERGLRVGAPNIGIEVDEKGDVKYAEHTGAALGEGRQELTAIENRGAAQGMTMLQRDVRQAQTAEAERLQRSEKDASLSSAAWSLEDGIEQLLAITAQMMGEPTGGEVFIDKTFTDAFIDTARMQVYSNAEAAGQITKQTMWAMWLAGNALPENFDPIKEADALANAARITLGPGANADAGANPDGGGNGPAQPASGEPPQ